MLCDAIGKTKTHISRNKPTKVNGRTTHTIRINTHDSSMQSTTGVHQSGQDHTNQVNTNDRIGTRSRPTMPWVVIQAQVENCYRRTTTREQPGKHGQIYYLFGNHMERQTTDSVFTGNKPTTKG